MASALDERLLPGPAGRKFLPMAFPDHWSFLLGEIALHSLLVPVLTGAFPSFFFHPDMTERPCTGSCAPLRGVPVSEAFASVPHMSFAIRGGLLLRQIHHWAAPVFVAAIGVDLLRILLTGAFRRPREVNRTIAVTLFGLTLLEGFRGCSSATSRAPVCRARRPGGSGGGTASATR
ncbi:cytochrome b N-terminal domain-containing protein [Streptomyces anandii]|uniref:cytochrome b N-terminal domain-containing protein n=1 Tax=Streptomyces anandii TaxID=285454 RepID=UPI0036FFF074